MNNKNNREIILDNRDSYNGIDLIQDFSVTQNDKLNIADLLIDYNPGTSDISNFANLSVTGGNTHLMIDSDGEGTAYSAQEVVTMNGVSGLDIHDLLNNGQLIAV